MPNCRLGDLAITVDCEVPENLGKIVKVIACKGEVNWSSIGPTLLWEVQCQSASSLIYFMADQRVALKQGPVPDIFLRPIRGLSEEQEDLQPSPELDLVDS